MRDEEEEEVDEDYIINFMDHYIRKPMEKGIKDIIKCQSNLQEMHLRSQKHLSNLSLKVDNANVNTKAQLNKLKGKMAKLKTKNQEFQTQLLAVREQNEAMKE